jgi:hypothetical protein
MKQQKTAIVFIHFGETFPEYFLLNINRTSRLFPNRQIYVVTDFGVVDNKLLKGLGQNVNFLFVQNRQSLRKSALDERLWDGWWQKTIDRLLLFGTIHEMVSATKVIHVESDVALMPSFPFSWFDDFNLLAWPSHDSTNDIASLVFSPNVVLSKKLSHAVDEAMRANPSITDMQVLLKVRKELPNEVFTLPQRVNSERLANPPGIFDGLDFGNWITGSDPKARMGWSRKRIPPNNNDVSLFKQSQFVLEDNQLFILKGYLKEPINNLHVHSKEHRFFRLVSHGDPIVISIPLGTLHCSAFLEWFKTRVKIYASSIFSRVAWERLLGRLATILNKNKN